MTLGFEGLSCSGCRFAEGKVIERCSRHNLGEYPIKARDTHLRAVFEGLRRPALCTW